MRQTSAPSDIVILDRPFWSACGHGVGWDACWNGLLASRRALFDSAAFFGGQLCGSALGIIKAPGLDAVPYARRGAALARITLDAVREDIEALKSRLLHGQRMEVIVATSHGDPGPSADAANVPGRLSADTAAGVRRDPFVAAIERELRDTATVDTISAACASALVAVAIGAMRLRSGRASVVVVIAQDVISRIAFAGFRLAGAMSRSMCRPFDRERDGINVAEGVAVFALATGALAGGSQMRGTVRGTGQSCDARHLVEPTGLGIERAVRTALHGAGLKAGDIGAVYWHGTGTRQNDAAEAEVAGSVFQTCAVPAGTSTKGSLGHTMGASGAFNLMAACATIEHGLLPPTCGLSAPEHDWLNVKYGEEPARVSAEHVLVNALGFGGVNAAVVVGPPH